MSDGKFKKPAIIAAIASLAATALFIFTVAFTDNLPLLHGVSIGMMNDNLGSGWSVSYRTSGERLEHEFDISGKKTLKVTASCESGTLYMLLLGGDKAQVVDITHAQGIGCDLSEFVDKVTVMLYNDKARDADIKISFE